MVKFTSDQLLVISDLKSFDSSTPSFDLIITKTSHFDKCFFSRVKDDPKDVVFILRNNHYHLGNLLALIEVVTSIDFIGWSSFAWFAVAESDSKSPTIPVRPIYFLESWIFLYTFIGKRLLVRDLHIAFKQCNCSSNCLASSERLESYLMSP